MRTSRDDTGFLKIQEATSRDGRFPSGHCHAVVQAMTSAFVGSGLDTGDEILQRFRVPGSCYKRNTLKLHYFHLNSHD